MGIIGKLFTATKEFISDSFSALLSFLKNLIGWLLDGIYFLLKPFISLLDAIFYLLYKLGLLLVDVIFVVISIGRLTIGIMVGGTKTIMTLKYNGDSPDLGGMALYFDVLQPFIDVLHLNIIASIATFGIWIITYYAALRIIGSFK